VLVTVTNNLSKSINVLDSYAGATGGVRVDALPHPFGWIGELAAGVFKQFAMHPSDLYYKTCENGSSQNAWQQWQQMIQAGKVSMVVAAQTGVQALDEIFLHAV
jgi:hypothetical protein